MKMRRTEYNVDLQHMEKIFQSICILSILLSLKLFWLPHNMIL